MASESLKPCPFCGGAPERSRVPEYGDMGEGHLVLCSSCHGGTPYFQSGQHAAYVWNHRDYTALLRWLRRQRDDESNQAARAKLADLVLRVENGEEIA